MKTLLAHEWIAKVGGSENVFEQIRRIFPHSRAVCLWNDDPHRFQDVEETWLARSPLRGHKVAALPFNGSAWSRVNLAGADRVVVSSHAFAHHLAARAARYGIPAYAYVHSPARYVWAPDLDIRGNSLAGRLGRSFFRRWDRRHASKNVHYAANSQFVASRIAHAWGVESTVIYPPVDVEGIRTGQEPLSEADSRVINGIPETFVLGASRFVSYKNLEAAIRAGEILNLPVVLAGSGPDEPRLRTLAADARTHVFFTGRISRPLLLQLYRRARLFVHMAIEDFGITPVEAMACGTPVLVNELGGSRESVLAAGGGTTSRWNNSDFPDPHRVKEAVQIDMTKAKLAVERFSVGAFQAALQGWIETDD